MDRSPPQWSMCTRSTSTRKRSNNPRNRIAVAKSYSSLGLLIRPIAVKTNLCRLNKECSKERRIQMTSTYKAVEVSAPGTLRVVERKVTEPGAGQVRIRVEACGICHTDAATVTGVYPGLKLPRVPGHEVVGRIEALGSGVSRWKIGQRVGVGLIAGEDGVCEPCRRGDTVNCQNPISSGVTMDGGYAEVMIAEARGIVSVPDELKSAEAAPLLCAGVTTYNALRNAGLRGGDLVAVQGIGGLGHLGIQFAR